MKRINSKEAIKLNKKFIDTRSKELNKIVERETGKPNEKDAISSWFSIEELKSFIADVEKEGTAIGKTVNGLRVYFGAYSKNGNSKKDDLSTVFMVPTEARVGASQKDGIDGGEGGSDIEDLGGLNGGQTGIPPEAVYPQ